MGAGAAKPGAGAGGAAGGGGGGGGGGGDEEGGGDEGAGEESRRRRMLADSANQTHFNILQSNTPSVTTSFNSEPYETGSMYTKPNTLPTNLAHSLRPNNLVPMDAIQSASFESQPQLVLQPLYQAWQPRLMTTSHSFHKPPFNPMESQNSVQNNPPLMINQPALSVVYNGRLHWIYPQTPPSFIPFYQIANLTDSADTPKLEYKLPVKHLDSLTTDGQPAFRKSLANKTEVGDTEKSHLMESHRSNISDQQREIDTNVSQTIPTTFTSITSDYLSATASNLSPQMYKKMYQQETPFQRIQLKIKESNENAFAINHK